MSKWNLIRDCARCHDSNVVDKLEPGSEYDVVIEAAGYKAYSGKAKLDKSLDLGLILLEKA